MNHQLKKDNKKADQLREIGNKHYSRGEYFDALIFFNHSLCFAIDGSDSMGCAYANRSAVYLELDRFELCLKNIELARHYGYPKKNMKKLQEREFKCLIKMRQQETICYKSPWDFFKLSYEPNAKIPFLANCLEMRNDKKFGPHLITNHSLNSGDFIAITEGVLKLADPMARLHRCIWCVKDCLLDLLPCPGCPMAMFCSPECLGKGLLDFHYEHCFYCPIPKDRRKTLNFDLNDVFFTEKVNTRLAVMFDGEIMKAKKFLDSKKGKAWNFFDFDWSKMDEETIEKNLLLICLTKHKYREDICSTVPNDPLGMSTAINEMENMESILSRFISVPGETSKVGSRGNVEIYDSIVSNFIGRMMNPLRCFTSISCAPNACFLSVDNKLVLMVLRPIEAGEKITVSLGLDFVNHDKADRQRLHRKKCGKPCKCIACINNWRRVFGKIMKANPSTSQELAMMRIMLKTKDINKTLSDSNPSAPLWILLDSIQLDNKILAKPTEFYP